MKTLYACLLAFVGVTLMGAAPQEKKRIQDLEKRVAQLEQKVASLEEVLNRMLTQGFPKLQDAIDRGILRSKVTSCATNLGQLWKMQLIYSVQYGGPQKLMVQDTGSDFWLALSRTKPPLITKENFDIFVCPVTGKVPTDGFANYRGPAIKVQLLKSGDPVGCCEPGCHRDGTINVVLKGGDVKVVGPNDDLYLKAIAGTKGTSK